MDDNPYQAPKASTLENTPAPSTRHVTIARIAHLLVKAQLVALVAAFLCMAAETKNKDFDESWYGYASAYLALVGLALWPISGVVLSVNSYSTTERLPRSVYITFAALSAFWLLLLVYLSMHLSIGL